eukprot:gene2401-2549_t
MNLSLVFAAFAFMFLGFSAASGTKSVDQKYAPPSINDDDAPHQEELGFGFAVFFHIVGFILSSAVSIYLSPLITGTKNESKILSTPQNIDGTDSPSAPLPTANAVPDLYAGYPEPPSALNKI